jgi:hypothetical protein
MLVNEMNKAELFQLSTEVSGDLESYNDSSLVLKQDAVYILLDSALKKIFLWIGRSAGVRSRFIGTNAAQTLQRRKGLTHRVVTIDQGEESQEFVQTISFLIPSEQFL